MAKYILGIRLRADAEKRDPRRHVEIDRQVIELDGYETPAEKAFWERNNVALRAGHGSLYVLDCDLVSLNGMPIPEQWLIRDQPACNCFGDTMIVDESVQHDDFELIVVD